SPSSPTSHSYLAVITTTRLHGDQSQPTSPTFVSHTPTDQQNRQLFSTRHRAVFSVCTLGLAGRMARSAIRATSWRGANRGELLSSQFAAPPVTTVLLRRSRARSAAWTTCSGGIRRPTCASSPATSKKPVSVDPGHSAVTRTPVPRVSAHSASVNDSTNAFVAP